VKSPANVGLEPAIWKSSGGNEAMIAPVKVILCGELDEGRQVKLLATKRFYRLRFHRSSSFIAQKTGLVTPAT
jgi:hypothetical protein